MKTILICIAFLGVGSFLVFNADAATYYVRDGGGPFGASSTTCNGLTNAVFTGNNGPHCAVSSPAYILGWGCYNEANNDCDSGSPLMAGGDILYIDGDSDLNPGSQAQYRIGYLPNGSIFYNPYAHCASGNTYDCMLGEVPGGTPSHQTSVIGTGVHRPQLWGSRGVYSLFKADNGYTTLQWLELTQHSSCGHGNAAQPCGNGSDYVGNSGLTISGTGVILTDIYIHGTSTVGINTGNLGSITATRLWVIGNAYGGVEIGAAGNQSVTGTLTFNQPIIDWNGCVEQHPLKYPGIENPLNFANCQGPNGGIAGGGGFGDALSAAASGNKPVGNWTIIGPGSISFNTKDGISSKHGIANQGSIKVDKMRLEGNAGEAVKISGLNDYFINNLIIADCDWWQGAPQTEAGALTFANGDGCRAGGSAIYFSVSSSGTYAFYNNTIVTEYIAFETDDDANAGCAGGLTWNIDNNILLGGVKWNGNRQENNSLDTFYFNDGYHSGGSCGTISPSENYNVYSGFKDAGHFQGPNDKCQTAPPSIDVLEENFRKK